MKRIGILLLLLLLTGCSRQSVAMERGLALRNQLLQAASCSFSAGITADYGDKIHTFSMECISDAKGNIRFTVVEPDSISGISGTLTGEGGELTFDETALSFDLIADGQLSPVSAPWILLKTLRSGYLTSACNEEDTLRLSADDSYENDPLRLDIWLNHDNIPTKADILHNGRRILSVTVEGFQIL